MEKAPTVVVTQEIVLIKMETPSLVLLLINPKGIRHTKIRLEFSEGSTSGRLLWFENKIIIAELIKFRWGRFEENIISHQKMKKITKKMS